MFFHSCSSRCAILNLNIYQAQRLEPAANRPRFHEWPAEALYSVAKQQITGQSVELPNLEGALKMSGPWRPKVGLMSKQLSQNAQMNYDEFLWWICQTIKPLN